MKREELRNKWFMVTVVVKDTFPADPLPIRNKVRVRIYINGVMELDKYLDGRLGNVSSSASVLKTNSGNLYVAPAIKFDSSTNAELSYSIPSADKVRMADLSYFNYALESAEIVDLFSSEFSKTIAPGITSNTDFLLDAFPISATGPDRVTNDI